MAELASRVRRPPESDRELEDARPANKCWRVFSGKHEHQEAAREAEIKELRAKVGELVIERDFLSKAFGR